MKVFIGADHGGFSLKEVIVADLVKKGIEIEDLGTYSRDSVDYPDYAKKVTEKVLENNGSLGILVCGTGIGMSMAANKVKGIRAAVVGDVFSAVATREHNDANVLCLGERVIGPGLALLIVDKFISTEFQGGRHANRVGKICSMEDM